MGKLRKVQRTPTGTFFVCLPRSWAEQHGLKKGALVALNETSDGKLFIDVASCVEQLPKMTTVFPGPYLSREIVGRYLLGYDVIRVEAKERFDFDVRSTIKRTVSSLIGLEIVEETSSQIVLQCLLAPSSFPPETLLLRNYGIVAGMNRDAATSLVDGDLQLAKSVVARDDESDRQYFLLVRVLRTVIQSAGLSEKLSLTLIDCLDYRLAASFVEALGDVSVQVANVTLELSGVKPFEDLKNLLISLQAVCCDASDQALKAFVGKNVALAENVRSVRVKVDDISAEAEKAAGNQPLVVMPKFLAGVSLLKHVYELGVDLADLVS
jgi:phosphate uptake regulator